jgi:hypothetical protein
MAGINFVNVGLMGLKTPKLESPKGIILSKVRIGSAGIILNGLYLSVIEANPTEVMNFIKSKGSSFELINGMIEAQIFFTSDDVMRELPNYYVLNGTRIFSRMYGRTRTKYKGASIFLADKLEKIISNTIGALSTIANEVFNMAEKATAMFRKMLELALAKALDIAASFNKLIISIFTGISGAIMQAVDAVVYGIQQTVNRVAYGVRQTVNGLSYGVHETINEISYRTRQIANGIADVIQQTANGVLSAFTYVTDTIFNAISKILMAVVNVFDVESTPSQIKPSSRPVGNTASPSRDNAGPMYWLADVGKYFAPGFAGKKAANVTPAHCPPTNRAPHNKMRF